MVQHPLALNLQAHLSHLLDQFGLPGLFIFQFHFLKPHLVGRIVQRLLRGGFLD